MVVDLGIIGGGPAGYVAAEKAGKASLSVLLFEKNRLGGVCLNEGCIPTKTLLYSAKIYDHTLGGSAYGVTADNVNFDLAKVIGRKERVVRRLVGGIALKMKQAGVTVVNKSAFIVGYNEEGCFIVATDDGEQYLCKQLLIATGSSTVIPRIERLDIADTQHIVTNRELLQLKDIPSRLTIVGGGVIGMEFAAFFNSIGSKVVVIEMLPEILAGADSELSGMLREIYSKKGIEFRLSSRVTAIEGNRITFADSEGVSHTIESDKILISVGRKPIVEGLGLENIGVALEGGAIKVDEKMRTNVQGLFAAGDVTGFSLLAHTASREGEVVVNNILCKEDTMRYNAIPNIVYTNPELASVGLTEQQAVAKGIEYRVSKLPMTFSGRFMAENEGLNGLCKIIISADNKIIGAHLLGNPSSEIIWGIAAAIEKDITVKELESVVFPHPTVSEIIKESLS